MPLNPFGIQFMSKVSKDRLDCVVHKSFCKQITFDATKNTFLVLVRAQESEVLSIIRYRGTSKIAGQL